MIQPNNTGRPGPVADSAADDLSVFKAHVPETLDLSAVKPAWRAYACWVISAVVFRRFIDREADENTFVPLDSRYVNEHIPQRVRRPLLADLIGAGVLECDGRYYFGDRSGKAAGRHIKGGPGKCLCYRIGQDYRGARIRAREITHPELLRKMNRFRREEREKISDPIRLALRDWHDRVEVLPTAPYGEHPLLDRMIEGERRFTVCEQGRIHTNVANLPRQYRQYLRLDGRELVSLDISTSQPLILALLLRNQTSPTGRRKGSNQEAVCNPCSESSLNDYLRDCLSGCVYDRIVPLTGYARDDVKSLFLAVIYGHPAHMHTKVGEAVRRLYPAVFDAVVELNYSLGHGGLPRLMQRMESAIMIGRVAARLIREHPGMPLLTVHDCMVVPPEYEEAARRIISEEWMDEFGVEPRVKTSAFTAPQQPREPRAGRPRVRTADVTLAA